MIQKVFRVIKLIVTYARLETIIKLLYCTIAASTAPVILYATQKLIDSISFSVSAGGNVNGQVLVWLCVLFAAMVFTASLSNADCLLNIRFQKKLNETFSMELLDKFRRIAYKCYEDPGYHDILMRMGDHPQERLLTVFNDVISVLSLCVTVCFLVVLFIQVSPILSALYFLVIVMMMFLDFRSMKMMNEMFSRQSFSEREFDYYRNLLSDKHALLELKVFGSVSYISNLCRKKNAEVLKERMDTTLKSQRYFALSSICTILWVILVLFSLTQSVFQGSITLGTFVALAGSAGTVLSTTESLSFKLSNVARKCYEIEYYDAFLAMEDSCFGDAAFGDETSGDGASRDGACGDGTCEDTAFRKRSEKGIIELKNVYFKYTESSDYVLKNVTMTIDPGKATALVGENGSGKSTLVKLLCRLYRPDSGSILIDGKDIYAYSPQEYHKIISTVFQDFVKYAFTLRENVAIGNLETLYEDDTIKTALKDIAGFEKYSSLDIPLGKIHEDGIGLSGGEWQKIAIARACVGNSRLIIMDEPTASLDPAAESRLYTAFMEVMERKGTFVISHRMASARLADTIYVIHNGQIEECGSHDALIQKGGLYRQMYEAQSEWYQQ